MKSKALTFPVGGVHPPDSKLSAKEPIKTFPVPKIVSIPLSQHIGKPAKPIVNVGDRVFTGQLIAEADGFISANVHSSVTGTIKKFDEIMDVGGRKKLAFIIETEETEIWVKDIDTSPDIISNIKTPDDDIRKKVISAGIVGMGGATFPSHVKLSVPEGKTAEFLIINGVECEPYLTADHRLMLEHGEEILIGIDIILKATGIQNAKIGIEENKPDVIKHLKKLAEERPYIKVYGLKTQYPQGGERQLIKSLTGREVPPAPKGLPIDVGCVVFNVATAFAIYEAVQKNKPLIERIVSVTGKNLSGRANLKVRIGTSVAELIEACGGMPDDTGKVVSGGPMMGRAISTVDVPVVKGVSGIVLFPENESKRKEVLECIRCGKCVSTCPLGLEPYLLMTLAQRALWDKAEEEKITSCCECACCTFACPANRPLLDYIKLGKSNVLNIMRSRSAK